MTKLVRRDAVKQSLQPIIGLLTELIEFARAATTLEVVANAHPKITREAHLRRLGGTERWILIADGIVAHQSLPAGFWVASTDAQHNSGQYVFRFPGGVFTVRHVPHQEPEEGAYLQECMEELLKQVPLAASIDGDADLKAFLDVRADGLPRFIITHPTLAEPMKIAFDEFDAEPVVATTTTREPAAKLPRRGVRSKRAPKREHANEDSRPSPS
jgi:hypothetical protein